MKRTGLIAAGVVVGSFALSGVASAQTTTTEPATTTTEAATTTVAPTTTVDPGPTTTVDPGPTTTVDPGPTTTVPIVLPGEWVSGGDVQMGSKFVDMQDGTPVNPDCSMLETLDGTQHFNIVRDQNNFIMAAYGYGTFGGGNEMGMAMVQLNPLPIGLGIYRTFGTCNQDGFVIGSYGSTENSATLLGSGMGGLIPYSLSSETYLRINVTASQTPAQLDLNDAQTYLTKPRP